MSNDNVFFNDGASIAEVVTEASEGLADRMYGEYTAGNGEVVREIPARVADTVAMIVPTVDITTLRDFLSEVGWAEDATVEEVLTNALTKGVFLGMTARILDGLSETFALRSLTAAVSGFEEGAVDSCYEIAVAILEGIGHLFSAAGVEEGAKRDAIDRILAELEAQESPTADFKGGICGEVAGLMVAVAEVGGWETYAALAVADSSPTFRDAVDRFIA